MTTPQRVLITGGAGFVAPYLTKELLARNFTPILADIRKPNLSSVGSSVYEKVEFHLCNLVDFEATKKLVETASPDAVIHLAGLSHVGKAWENRSLLADVNIGSTINLCKAMHQCANDILFLFVSSAHVFETPRNSAISFNENSVVAPASPYGASKLASEYVVRTFASNKFKPYIVRPFNHIGQGQSRDFVCSAFAHRVLEAKDGSDIITGALDTERDFSDVRDIVRAYRLIIEKRPKEDLFVLGSGKGTTIRSILEFYIGESGKSLTPKVDQSLLRPQDPAKIVADSGLAHSVLGWECEIPLKQTLKTIYDELKR